MRYLGFWKLSGDKCSNIFQVSETERRQIFYMSDFYQRGVLSVRSSVRAALDLESLPFVRAALELVLFYYLCHHVKTRRIQ